MKERFKIIQSRENCFLIDNEHQFASLPLAFDYKDLTEYDKKKVNEWLNYLNR